MKTVLLFLVLLACTTSATYYGRSKVQTSDRDWWEIQARHFTIYYPQGAEAAAETLLVHTERELLALSERFDYLPESRIPIILYISPFEFRQTDIYPYELPQSVGGFTEYFKGRVVVPFTGYWSEFRHVVAHELCHAFVYDMLYHHSLLDIMKSNSPLWVEEGLAEYASLGWDPSSEAEFRDMVITGQIVTVEELSTRSDYLVYREGQAIYHFIVERYGEDALNRFVTAIRGAEDLEGTVKASLGMSVDQLNQKFLEWARETYWAQLAVRENPSNLGNAIYDGEERVNQTCTVLSPDGGRFAGVEWYHANLAVVVRSSITGEVEWRPFVSGGVSDLSVSPLYRVCSFSSGGDSVVVACQHISGDRLRICTSEGCTELPFEMDMIRDPSWSPDGSTIAFVGMQDSHLNLYVWSPSAGLLQLTDDALGEREPSWTGGSILASVELGDGRYSISSFSQDSTRIDLFTSSSELRYPMAVPGGVVFLSDQGGYPDLYLLPDGEPEPVKLTALYSTMEFPSWSDSAGVLTFVSSDWNGGGVFLAYDVTDRRVRIPALETLEVVSAGIPLATRAAHQSARIYAPGDDALPEGMPGPDSGTPQGPPEPGSRSEQIFPDSGSSTLVEVCMDSLACSISPYSPSLSVDYATATASYDSYLGLAGYTEVVLSDILAHHRIVLDADLDGGSLSDADVALYYSYLPHKMDFGVGLYRQSFRYLFRFSDGHLEEVRDNDLGGFGMVSLPLSPSFHLEGELSYRMLTRKGIWNSDADFSEEIVTLNAGAILDNALWGVVGPRVGSRLAASVEVAPEIAGSASYGTLAVDLRNYLWVTGSVTLATRLAGAGSWGEDAPVFFLGGAMPHRLLWGEVDSLDELLGFYSNYGDMLRGWDYASMRGRRYGLFSAELRVPFVRQLSLDAPLPITLTEGRGALFLDIGSAFDDFTSFRGASTDGGFHLEDLRMGVGLGYRLNLGYFLLKHDIAWRTDFRGISRRPIGYITLGAEF
jgi:hypothetical protein